MILLLEYFVPQNADRHKEFLTCLEENIKNTHIKKIVLLISDNSVCPLTSDKIEIMKLANRPTYSNMFEICNQRYVGEICIVSNADIIFDNTLKHITHENISNKFVALNRWDLKPDGKITNFRHHIGDSQDSWIFRSPMPIQGANFTMGVLGCDNKITYMAHAYGMNVVNPSEQIITKHLHNTQFRTTSADQRYRIGGKHLLVFGSKDINTRSIIVERDWEEFVQRMNAQVEQQQAQQQQAHQKQGQQ